MTEEERRQRKLERLEEQRRRVSLRLELQRQHVEARFERARSRIKQAHDHPNVSQQRIIDAALELLDEDGLNNLSLRKLAGSLNMQAPALYWHFKNKEVLIDYMAEAILSAEFKELEARKNDEPWQDWLMDVCRRLRSAMLARRDGARVVAGAHLFPAVTLMKLFETSMESLTSAGLEMQQANLIVTTAAHFVFGNVIEQQAAPTQAEVDEFVGGDRLERFPLMKASTHESIKAAMGGYDEFDDALRLIIGNA
jgi:TetR/AcrR family tetracycline transcriptional repressor